MGHGGRGTSDTALCEAIQLAIQGTLPDAAVEVNGGGGHFNISVVSAAFEGKSMLQQQRMVYAALGDLILGSNAPVHAVDSLKTRVP
jgi:acid stress-induced BolA-like protein IbaG/YrbA